MNTRSAAPRCARILMLCVGLSLCVVQPLLRNTASAQTPTVRSQTPVRVFISPEIATLRLLGTPKTQTSWNIGLHIRQGIEVRRLIAWLRIGGDAWLTYQPGPPLQRGMRGFTTAGALGYSQPMGALRLTAYGEYAVVNLSGNPLYDTLGSRTMYHTLGGGGAIAYTGVSPLFAEVRVTAHHWFGTAQHTSSMQVIFSIGLETQLRR